MILLSGKWRYSMIVLFTVASLAVLGLPTHAQDPADGAPIPMGSDPRPGQQLRQAANGPPPADGLQQELVQLLNLPEIRKALAITEEQRIKLDDIAFNSRKASIQQGATLEVQRLELQRLVQSENPDRPAIDKKITEISQAQAALMRTQINALVDARSTLTREQMQKVRDHMQRQMRQRMQQSGQPGMRPRLNQVVPAPPIQPEPPPPAPQPPPTRR